MNTSRKGLLVVLLLGASSLGLVAGCGKKELHGQPIPSDVPAVTLEQVMKDPTAFKDREVILQGNYGGHCCATDFNYKEGTNAAECYYPGFEVPHTQAGRPVKIHAVVRVRDKHEEAGKQVAEGRAETGPEVYLEAKGVQFK